MPCSAACDILLKYNYSINMTNIPPTPSRFAASILQTLLSRLFPPFSYSALHFQYAHKPLSSPPAAAASFPTGFNSCLVLV